MTPADRYALHRHAWGQLAELVRPLDRYAIRAPGPDASFSVLEHVLHELDTSRWFVATAQGSAPPEPFERDQVEDGAALVVLAGQCHEVLHEAIGGLGESTAGVLVGRKEPVEVKTGELLEILIWHASHHRSQLSLLLRGRGFAVPSYSPVRWLMARSRTGPG